MKLFLLLITFVQTASQSVLDNKIIENPTVICTSESVKLQFRTQNPFNGHVYVRGHYEDENCHKDHLNSGVNGGNLTISLEQCSLRRQRKSEPKGISISTTVVVSFHRQFVTAADKAYHLSCIYMEDNMSVTQSLDVSSLPTTDLHMGPPMPVCKYEVLNDYDGAETIGFAKVGDRVFHKWSCVPLATDKEMYCMIVRNCTVDDGEYNYFEVVDEKGCTRDQTVLAPPLYTGDLEVLGESNVFKFADQPRLFFTCQIQLTVKSENRGICPKPECDAETNRFRYKRESLESNSRLTDVMAEPIVIFDLDDLPAGNLYYSEKKSDVVQLKNVCFSNAKMIVSLLAMVTICLATLFFSFYHIVKRRCN